MVPYSAMAIIKEQESNNEETREKRSKWGKLKCDGIIGAAAITGGNFVGYYWWYKNLNIFWTVL